MTDTVSEDVKLDADAIKAARKAFCERPGLPLDKQLDMAIRAYLAATKPASPLAGDVTRESIIAVAEFASGLGWETSSNIIRALAELAASRPKEDTHAE